jgi:hypothetical protein
MTKTEEFRRHAGQCLRAADLARTADAKQLLINMAQRWNDLARRAQRWPLEAQEPGGKECG